MHQNAGLADEVGVEIRDFEVIDSDGFFQAFVGDILDGALGAVGEPDGHAGVESAGLHPALAFHVEGVLRGGIDDLRLALAVGDGHVGDLVRGVDEGADDLFVGDLAGFLVGCQNHIAGLDHLNGDQTGCGGDLGTGHKAFRCGDGVADGAVGGGQHGGAPDGIGVVQGGIPGLARGLAIDQVGEEGGRPCR